MHSSYGPILPPSVSCHMHRGECRVPEEDSLLSRLLPAATPRLLIDYRLFVLASLVMKSWARLGKDKLLAKTERLHDPFPFALRPNRECSCVILHDLIFKHLEGCVNHIQPRSVDLNNQLFQRLCSLTS